MKPRETGGNIPKPKVKRDTSMLTNGPGRSPAKKVRIAPPRPEVSVQAKKPAKVGSKKFPAPKPEVTRPVTPKQRKAIDTKVKLANRAYKIKKQNTAENKAEGHYFKVAGVTVHPEAGVKPGMRILNTVATPLHAVSGAANTAAGRGLHGLSPGQLVKGAKTGIKQKTTYSDVLKTAGVKSGAVRGVAGFAGDVLLDPTTYVTFGTSSVGREAASKAGARVAAKALKQGMTKDVADGLAKQAAKKAAKDAEDKVVQRAVTVGVGKKSVKILPLAAKKKAKEGSLPSDIGEALNPRYVHPATTEDIHKTLKSAQLEERGQSAAGVRKSIERARKLARKVSPAEHQQIIDALESRSLGSLPEELRPVAKRIQDDFKYMARKEREQGLLTREIKDYVPHIRRQDIEKGGKVNNVVRPGNPAILGSSKARKIDGSLSQLRQEVPHLFTENLPVIYAKRGAASAEAVARSKTLKEIANTGRKLTPDAAWDTSTEAVYKVTPTRLVKLVKDDKIQAEEIAKAAHGQSPGQYVILNQHTADKVAERTPTVKGKFTARYDKAQGLLKTALTVPRPAYHVRNLLGDSWNAYLGQSFPSLLHNFWHSARIERGVYRAHKADSSLTVSPDDFVRTAGTKIGGKKVTYDELANRARQAGVIDSGFYGRDIVDLVGHRPRSKIVEPMRRVGQYRENLVRLNTFTAALKRGLNDREAAGIVSDLHFDYGDLSQTERSLRRVFPFYTFTARNTPLQARKVVTRPGKYANLEKLREEAAKAAGLPVGENNDYQRKLKDYEQLGLPVPIPGLKLPAAGGKKTQALAYAGLPVTDLNRITANPVEQFQLTASMVTGFKALAELPANYSVFFRDKIDSGQKVSAPDLVGKLPQRWQKYLGVVYATDKVTGKKTWRWDPTVDYAVKQLPEITVALQALTSGANRRGQAPIKVGPVNIRPGVPGVRVQPYDPNAKKLNDLYDRQDGLKSEVRYTDPGSTKRIKLNAELGKLAHQIAQTKRAMGYKITGEEGRGGKILTQPGPSVHDILGHGAPTVNDILGG